MHSPTCPSSRCDPRSILDAPDRAEANRRIGIIAQKYKSTAPELAPWIEANVRESLTVLALPCEHRRRLRTTNTLEALNKEIKRRTRVTTLFPNTESLLRLVSAVLAEVDDEWTRRTHLPRPRPETGITLSLNDLPITSPDMRPRNFR